MNKDLIEIQAVRALRIDAYGRVGRLRVYGLTHRDDRRVDVSVCVAPTLDVRDPWPDQGASALARAIDTKRTPGIDQSIFPPVLFEPNAQGERAYAWVAEIDVLLPPAVPPIFIGGQTVPINMRAIFRLQGSFGPEKRESFIDLAPVAEFDTGVLLVHGIGVQRRAETLTEWSAPVLRWINAWLSGATDDIGQRLHGKPVESWKKSLATTEPSAADEDWFDRLAYTQALVRKAEAQTTFGGWRTTNKARMHASGEAGLKPSVTTDAERKQCNDVVCEIDQRINATAVGGSAEFREAYVLDVGTHAAEPSSVEMHLEAMASDGYMLRSRWMLAESHWGESFWAPSFFRFARWCLMTAPIVLVHYIVLARDRGRSLLFWLPRVFGLCVGLTLAQLAFIALMVLWLVPWDRLRSAVLRLQASLAGIVGDSYILLEDPVQRRAIIDRVQRDLNWLLQRCRNVVVVAHSQGAAVAEMVLSGRDDPAPVRIKSFITLGAGIQTLSAIEKYSRSAAVTKAGWYCISWTLVLFAAGVAAILGCPPPIPALMAIVALCGQAYAAMKCIRARAGRLDKLPGAAKDRPLFDFFAKRDLVPYGPLMDPELKFDKYHPAEVRNRNSYLSDHVLYWQNPEQVVGPLARLVGAAAEFTPLTNLLPDDDDVFKQLDRARLSRLGFLRVARGAITLTTVVLIAMQWWAWIAIGTWVRAWVASKVGSAAPPVRPELWVWLQAALVLLPFVIYKTLINATFDAWTTAEVERLLRRSAGAPATHWTAIFVTLLVLVLSATIAFLWPMDAPVVVAGTALVAIALTWIARRVHVRCVRGP